MGEKAFSNSSGIIATHTRDIDSNSADERPVGGSIIVTEGSGIFTKNYILDPMQSIFNSPMFTNPLCKLSCRSD